MSLSGALQQGLNVALFVSTLFVTVSFPALSRAWLLVFYSVWAKGGDGAFSRVSTFSLLDLLSSVLWLFLHYSVLPLADATMVDLITQIQIVYHVYYVACALPFGPQEFKYSSFFGYACAVVSVVAAYAFLHSLDASGATEAAAWAQLVRSNLRLGAELLSTPLWWFAYEIMPSSYIGYVLITYYSYTSIYFLVSFPVSFYAYAQNVSTGPLVLAMATHIDTPVNLLLTALLLPQAVAFTMAAMFCVERLYIFARHPHTQTLLPFLSAALSSASSAVSVEKKTQPRTPKARSPAPRSRQTPSSARRRKTEAERLHDALSN
jgi:hypothetical protein